MKIVNIHEAKTHLSRLLASVGAGEEVVIAKAGRKIARVVRYEEPRGERKLGAARGRIVLRRGWEKTPEEFMTALYGSKRGPAAR